MAQWGLDPRRSWVRPQTILMPGAMHLHLEGALNISQFLNQFIQKKDLKSLEQAQVLILKNPGEEVAFHLPSSSKQN